MQRRWKTKQGVERKERWYIRGRSYLHSGVWPRVLWEWDYTFSFCPIPFFPKDVSSSQTHTIRPGRDFRGSFTHSTNIYQTLFEELSIQKEKKNGLRKLRPREEGKLSKMIHQVRIQADKMGNGIAQPWALSMPTRKARAWISGAQTDLGAFFFLRRLCPEAHYQLPQPSIDQSRIWGTLEPQTELESSPLWKCNPAACLLCGPIHWLIFEASSSRCHSSTGSEGTPQGQRQRLVHLFCPRC